MTAEFKISRFKYTWRGAWTANTVYNPDNVVVLSGKVYVCLVRHTSNSIFYTDLLYVNNDVPPVPQPKWVLAADGITFVGNWQPNTEYFIGNIVKFGAVFYICLQGHVSTQQASNFNVDYLTNSYWTIFVNSFDWKTNWSVSTMYKIGDIVKYSGKLFICNTQHTSSASNDPGLLADSSKWNEFISNISWKGTWQTSTLYYVLDFVRYGGKIYRCNVQHQSTAIANNGLEFDLPNWSEFLDGIEYKESWIDNVRYKENDIVKYGAYLYKCVTHHLAALNAPFDTTKFEIYCPGQDYKNIWNSSTLYIPGDIVRHGGYLYASNSINIASEPNWDQVNTNNNWSLLFNGTRLRGEWNSNNTYLAGDLVRRNGQVYVAKRNVTLGIDVDIIGDGSTINSDDWDIVIPGSQWRGLWENNSIYIIGDTILWKSGAFRCISRHLSTSSNRPDTSFGLGIEWERYTFSRDENILSEIGDLKKYGNTGPERIVIGTQGQVLRVNNINPVWSNFNQSSSVYFVATNGNDRQDSGYTLNAPWRTLRYALDNITGPATVFVKTGQYEEILPLRIPSNVVVVGDELRGTVIKPAIDYFSSEDIGKYQIILDFIISFIGNILTGVTITNNLSKTLQSTIGPFATSTQTSYVIVRLNLIKQALTNYTVGAVTSTNTITSNVDVLSAISQLNSNMVFIQDEIVAYLNINYSTYVYNINVITSTVKRIIDALIYDLKYTGNYKSIETGRFFYNGANHTQNKLENMFLLNDSTGLKNCTLIGLEGILGGYNIYLTKRPSAGAYVSLDPGWGPNDSNTWIINKSPYIKNVTTFGTACIGLKVDGNLHNSGNKSIVANDFTQILSDGIGVWVNADGRSEIVSVFTYYNHIGYLCSNGGKIRSTNGNCSYGEYGAVAESFDLSETAITAIVNNRYYDAVVERILTNGSNILKLFFKNAGQNYTSVSYAVTGAGINAVLLGDEFRDYAVYQVRIANLDDSSDPRGTEYTLEINNAQAGNNYSITLAASTDFTSAELHNLRIVINSGTGAGQFGYIADYDNSTKIALIAKENFIALTITTTTAAGNTLTISNSNFYLKVNDKVCFTGNNLLGGVVLHEYYSISSIAGNLITLLDSTATPVVIMNDVGTMQMHRLGWNHFKPGYEIENILDTTTSYSVEPRLIFQEPTTLAISGELNNIDKWSSISYGNNLWVAVSEGLSNNGVTANYSSDGVNWQSTSIPSGGWTAVAYGGNKFVAVSKDGKAASSTDGINWILRTIPSAEYRSVIYGNGYWIAVASGGDIAARSVDGITWTLLTLPDGADWSDIAYGKGIFITVSQGDSSTSNVAYSNDFGSTWIMGNLTGGAKSISYGNDRFVAISGGYIGASNTYVSFDGVNWQLGTIKAANWTSLSYGQGTFVAVAAFENFAAYSTDGLEWKILNISNSENWSSVAFGKDLNNVKFITVSKDSDIIKIMNVGTRAEARAIVTGNKIEEILIFEPGCGYINIPTLTIIDPNNTVEATTVVRTATGVLANPSLINPGQGWQTISTKITVSGDGFMDQYQVGNELILDNVTVLPGPGDNLNITGINDYTYKVLETTILSGSPGNYRLKLLIAKSLEPNESPEHGTAITIRQKYSQVRLTGHDFLDVGLGNFDQTNYPNTLFPNGTVLSPQNEVVESAGGRVFYTSSDQEGNFRVGELFAVEQASGTVSINAEFFQLEGLEELKLGGVSIGGSGIIIREFSTDPLFVADSNNIVPTQAAIKKYIARRVSGGGSDAFTGQLTAGIVRVGPNLITTTTTEKFNIPVKVKFKKPINGRMLSLSYFVNTNDY